MQESSSSQTGPFIPEQQASPRAPGIHEEGGGGSRAPKTVDSTQWHCVKIVPYAFWGVESGGNLMKALGTNYGTIC